MKRIWTILLSLSFIQIASAQNLESLNGKDFKQPGKLNPAMTGIQEKLVRVLTDADVGSSYQLMLEGHLPFKIGNYMIGYERIYNEYVGNNMFNLSYAREVKSEKKYHFRWGASLQLNQRNLFNQDFDSAQGFTFYDLNGDLVTVPSLSDLRKEVDFVNIELGASLNYDNFIASIGIENIIKKNVSFDKNSTRSVPFAANLFVGGFLSLGENYTLFPSMVGSFFEEQLYVDASLEFNTPYVNLGTSYLTYDNYSAASANVAVIIKKMFVGLEYTHPIEYVNEFDQYPRFNLFFNSSIFKDTERFKSKFAQKVKNFY